MIFWTSGTGVLIKEIFISTFANKASWRRLVSFSIANGWFQDCSKNILLSTKLVSLKTSSAGGWANLTVINVILMMIGNKWMCCLLGTIAYSVALLKPISFLDFLAAVDAEMCNVGVKRPNQAQVPFSHMLFGKVLLHHKWFDLYWSIYIPLYMWFHYMFESMDIYICIGFFLFRCRCLLTFVVKHS